MKKIKDLTKGNIPVTLIKLAIPIMGTFILQMAYNMVDMIWIGRVGSDAVASIGTAGFFINLGFAINSIIVSGAGIKVAQKIGEGKKNEVQKYISNAFFLTITITVIYSILLLSFKNQLIDFFNLGNAEVEKTAKLYLTIVGLGLVINFSSMLYARLLNSLGDSKTSFLISSIGIVINIVLDPLLIFGLKMGVLGAAIATIIAQIVNIIVFIKVGKSKYVIDFNLKFESSKIKEIVFLGTPMALQRVLFTVFGIVLAKIIANWGPDAIAAQKIGLQVEALSYMTSAGMNGAVSAFVGQNFGAKKGDRIIKGYYTAFVLMAVWGVVTTIVFTVFPKYLILIFVNDPGTIKIGVSYLRIIGLSQLFMCIEIITNGSYSGIGKPKVPSMISISVTSLRIPLALILSNENILGLNGVWISIALTSIIKGIISPLLFKKELKRINIKMTKEVANA